jgi:hypothetical protein
MSQSGRGEMSSNSLVMLAACLACVASKDKSALLPAAKLGVAGSVGQIEYVDGSQDDLPADRLLCRPAEGSLGRW